MKVTSHTTTVCSVVAREELVEGTNSSEDTLYIDEVGTPESTGSIEKSSIDLPSPSIELNFQPADPQADFPSSFDKYSAQLTNTTQCANTRALLILELVLPKSLQPASFSTTWVKAWHGKLFEHLHWPKEVLILAQQPAFLANYAWKTSQPRSTHIMAVDVVEKPQDLNRKIDFCQSKFNSSINLAGSKRGKLFDHVLLSDVMREVTDRRQLLKDCFENLKPGGWVEIADLDCHFYAAFTGDSIPEALIQWTNYKMEQAHIDGKPLDAWDTMDKLLKETGFHEVQVAVKSVPVGLWMSDLEGLGQMNLDRLLLEIVETVACRVIEKCEGCDIFDECKQIVAALQNKHLRTFQNFYTFRAQKPLPSLSSAKNVATKGAAIKAMATKPEVHSSIVAKVEG